MGLMVLLLWEAFVYTWTWLLMSDSSIKREKWGNFSILEFITWITAVLGDANLLFFDFSESTWNLTIVELIFKACSYSNFCKLDLYSYSTKLFLLFPPWNSWSNILALYAVFIITQVLHLHSLSMSFCWYFGVEYVKVLMARDSVSQFWQPWYALISFAQITQLACFQLELLVMEFSFAHTSFLVVFVFGLIRSCFSRKYILGQKIESNDHQALGLGSK